MAVARGTRPALFALDINDGRIGDELEKRYGGDYRVVRVATSDGWGPTLASLQPDGPPVALALVAYRTGDAAAFDLLDEVTATHPDAMRGVAIPWGDRGAAEAVFRAASLGRIHFWTVAPWRPPNEDFHQRVGEVLREWVTEHVEPFEMVRIVAERGSARAHELRDLLTRNGIPHGSYDAASPDGQALLGEVGAPAERLPVLVFFDGEHVVDPSTPDLARALGVHTHPEEDDYDVVVVGGGLSGLAACVYASSEGLRTVMLEREAVGARPARHRRSGTTSASRAG